MMDDDSTSVIIWKASLWKGHSQKHADEVEWWWQANSVAGLLGMLPQILKMGGDGA